MFKPFFTIFSLYSMSIGIVLDPEGDVVIGAGCIVALCFERSFHQVDDGCIFDGVRAIAAAVIFPLQ